MGKRLITQRRGKGSGPYKSPSHRFVGKAKHPSFGSEGLNGIVKDLVKCPGHTAPLAIVEYETGEFNLMIAPEGMKVKDKIELCSQNTGKGNILMLKDIPEGTTIFNIESVPGDGGKFVRSSGVTAKIVAKKKNQVMVLLPSKKQKAFNEKCRATIGVVAGGGRTDKPLMKAGNVYHKMRARNKLYPRVSGVAMNAVDHPFGGTTTSNKPGPTIARRFAPAGANVGKIRPRRTGKKK